MRTLFWVLVCIQFVWSQGFVSFDIKPEKATLTIDEVAYDVHKDINLTEGMHTYRIDAVDYFSYKDSFFIKANEHRTITINLSKQPYATATFWLKYPASIRLNAKPIAANETHKIRPGTYTYTIISDDHCDVKGSITLHSGEKREFDIKLVKQPFISVNANSNFVSKQECEDKTTAIYLGVQSDEKNSWVDLKAGVKQTLGLINVDYLDLHSLRNTASIYENNQWASIGTGFSIESGIASLLHASFMQHLGFVRTGFVADYRQMGANSTLNTDFSLQFALTRALGDGRPLHIGNDWVFIPFVGQNVGMIYHQDSNYLGLHLQGLVGVDFVMSDFFAISAFYAHEYLNPFGKTFAIALKIINPVWSGP